MVEIFEEMKKLILSHSDRMEIFRKYEFQSEGWIKTELLALLDDIYCKGHIGKPDKEVKANGFSKIDLVVNLHNEKHWIELKHYYVGKQKGQRWRVIDFIDDLEAECAKFKAVSAGDNAWILALCTVNPGNDDWQASIDRFNKNNKPVQLVSKTNPVDFPESYFIGVLNVGGLDA
jgi:hypothetical protein